MLSGVMVLSAACAAPAPSPSVAQPDSGAATSIVRAYTTWAPLFQAPRNISATLMAMCRSMTPEEAAYARSEHAQYYVQVYTNPIGSDTIRQPGPRVFPEGSVIVKEKLLQDTRLLKLGAPQRVGLGIMLKREKNFDPVGGDWEYLYVDAAGRITRDQKQLEHCRACHSANRERDSVFYPAVLSQ